MKIVRILTIVLALMVLLIAPVNAFASEAQTLPDPGITPDSPFYFMDKWGQQISLAFTFGAENKAQKLMLYADERMAEIETMMVQNKIKEAGEAAGEHKYCLETAIKNLEQVKTSRMGLDEKMTLMAEIHLAIANRVSANATGEGQGLMTQTRERTMNCQETALKNMAQGNPEKAARLNLELMNRQLNRIQLQAKEPQGEGLRQQLEEYNRLDKQGEEISQIAKGLGQGTAVDRLVTQATANHLEVLVRVQQQVQGQAPEAIQTAIRNCIQSREQLMTRLQAQNQLGLFSQDPPLSNEWQNTLRQTTQNGTLVQSGPNMQNNLTSEEMPGQVGQLSQNMPDSSVPQGPAPNSENGIPYESGIDAPDEPNENTGSGFGTGPAPNSGDCIPDGSGFAGPNGSKN
jgi:hypothetical protein